MKKLTLLILIIFLIGCKTTPENNDDLNNETETHLFILSGQSNMNNMPLGPFNNALSDLSNTIIVKNAKSGRPIKDWYPNGYLYDALIADVWASLDQTPDTITFIWMQGEADAIYQTSSNYAENLEGLINQLRTDLNHQDINVIIGRISDFGPIYPFVYWDTIRSQQEVIADQRGYSLIDTDDLNGTNDDLHYTDEGYKILAERFSNEAVKLIINKKRGLTAPIT